MGCKKGIQRYRGGRITFSVLTKISLNITLEMAISDWKRFWSCDKSAFKSRCTYIPLKIVYNQNKK